MLSLSLSLSLLSRSGLSHCMMLLYCLKSMVFPAHGVPENLCHWPSCSAMAVRPAGRHRTPDHGMLWRNRVFGVGYSTVTMGIF